MKTWLLLNCININLLKQHTYEPYKNVYNIAWRMGKFFRIVLFSIYFCTVVDKRKEIKKDVQKHILLNYTKIN